MCYCYFNVRKKYFIIPIPFKYKNFLWEEIEIGNQIIHINSILYMIHIEDGKYFFCVCIYVVVESFNQYLIEVEIWGENISDSYYAMK